MVKTISGRWTTWSEQAELPLFPMGAIVTHSGTGLQKQGSMEDHSTVIPV